MGSRNPIALRFIDPAGAAQLSVTGPDYHVVSEGSQGGGRVKPRILVILFLISALGTLSCTRFEDVRPGMTEAEVVKLVGSPDRKLLDKKSLGVYGANVECADRVESALVYRRHFRSDVVVGLDRHSRVVCAWNAFVAEVTH
jgi:hypothetical protein